MELIFIRHGQGVHNTDVPDRLNIEDPHLTDKGRRQVDKLKSVFQFAGEDLFVVSPTIRTIETVNILTNGLPNAQKYVSPLAGPRMFPMPDEPAGYIVKCDVHLSMERIENEYTDFVILNKEDSELWTNGVNTMDEKRFFLFAQGMLDWLQHQSVPRAFLIAHDGTINHYRRLLGEKDVTRQDFLGEAGWHLKHI